VKDVLTCGDVRRAVETHSDRKITRLANFFPCSADFFLALFAVYLLYCEGVLTGSGAGGTAVSNKS